MSKNYEKYFEKTLPIFNRVARGKYAIVNCDEGKLVVWSDDSSSKAVVLFEISEVKQVDESLTGIIVELDIDLDFTTMYLTQDHGPEM